MTNEFDKFCRKIIKEAAMTPSGIEAKQQFFLHMAEKYQNKIKRIHARMNNFVHDEQDTSVFKKLEKQLKMSMTALKRAESGFNEIDISKYGKVEGRKRNTFARYRIPQLIRALRNPGQYNKYRDKYRGKKEKTCLNKNLKAAQAETIAVSPRNNGQIWGQEEMERVDRRYKELRQQNISVDDRDIIKQLAKEFNRSHYAIMNKLKQMRQE